MKTKTNQNLLALAFTLALATPLVAFSASVALLSLVLGVWARPWANRGIEATTYEMAPHAPDGIVARRRLQHVVRRRHPVRR